MKKIFLKIFLLAILLTACSKLYITQEKFNRLQPGMTKDQVIKLLGEPQDKSFDKGIESWQYQIFSFEGKKVKQVQFKDNQVISFGIDLAEQKRIEEEEKARQEREAKAREKVIVVLTPGERFKDIGKKCNFDSDCEYHDCYRRRCRGPNGCSSLAGQKCLRTSDCCEGDCQQGICQVSEKTRSRYFDIGSRCQKDQDCYWNDCQLNQCQGPWGCKALLGERCFFDDDCCDGSCLEGRCKLKKGAAQSYFLDRFRDLGKKCRIDSECQHNNCRLNRCVGPNDCKVLKGQRCFFDDDCCQGQCKGSICQ